jgi:hypothetical protein
VPNRRAVLVEQILESERRTRYVSALLGARLSPERVDPDSLLFDPLKGAVLMARGGLPEEAIWLVFLSVHFGRHRRAGWRYAREVYRGAGGPGGWDWGHIVGDTTHFASWILANAEAIKRGGAGGFGNHRKYESLADTGAVVSTYVSWTGPSRSQVGRIEEEVAAAPDDPRSAFSSLYDSMGSIHRFGRTARFDYLSMLSKLGLAAITADRGHLEEATGPTRGAALLFGGSTQLTAGARSLDESLVEMDQFLVVGADVLEDALCNWQKSPETFRPFRG